LQVTFDLIMMSYSYVLN